MYPTDEEAAQRIQAQYERTAEMVRGMPEVFHDLWAYAQNCAAVKASDGTVYPVSELTEAVRDSLGQVWVTFALLDADAASVPSFEQLTGAGGTLVPRSRMLGSITLRYDQIAAILVDEDEPPPDEDAA
ncbi:MAG TPA: hypothetical protein VKS60_24580 [Stellaceae bacterium]|nr:hypothetical protein [Stellaceae bacterium]